MVDRNKLHIDKLLTEVSVQYKSNQYIADEIFATVPVKLDSDKYRIYTRDFRIPETKRADKAKARELSFDVSTAGYILEKHALKDYVSDDQEANYDAASLRKDTTENLTDTIMRRKEKSVYDLVTTTGFSLGVSLAAANLWSANTTVSNPLPVIETGLITTLQASGFEANVGTIARQTLKDLKVHVSILDRIKYTSAEITLKMLQGLFDLDKLLVSRIVYDSSQAGLTEVITPMWGDKMLLSYNPGKAGPMIPATGYIFNKTVPMVRRWRDDERNCEAIEVEIKFQPKIVASLTGYLINNVY